MNIDKFEEKLSKNAAYRKKEISYLSSIIQNSEGDIKIAVIRSSFLILYAHFEGFTKESVRLLLEYIGKQNIKVSDLTLNMQSVYYTKKIKDLKQSNLKRKYHELLYSIYEEDSEFKVDPKAEGIVVTESNLKYELLEDILFMIGIKPSEFVFEQNETLDLKQTLIQKHILETRNKVAHGENFKIDQDRYNEAKEFVLDFINILTDKLLDIAMYDRYIQN
ncbi:MAE_28990/MAE_18760 family HEPN-like nuclease [Macrococcus equi]|uniref:MAE_28990/MAE_18760 family HEPN-like nuclease n=1 Tax=Macrococcus equi TaxID=3395462 RepID=UPI0039BDCC84